MTISPPTVAPQLWTPDDHVFVTSTAGLPTDTRDHTSFSDHDFRRMYEVDRTVAEILAKGYTRVALQFPDELLGDSERVYALVHAGINATANESTAVPPIPKVPSAEYTSREACCRAHDRTCTNTTVTTSKIDDAERKIFILADTSYSACCVDEIAAEHVAADVLIHYGRSCLSPTTRLPVIYVFTSNQLDLPAAVDGFKSAFPDKAAKVLLVADVTYNSHIEPLHNALVTEGYRSVFKTDVVHAPSALLPNRTLPADCNEDELKSWSLFHLMEPLPSLLLVLASRVDSIHYFCPESNCVSSVAALPLLRRRYALLSHARTAGIVGILVNTLNVKHYLPMIARLKQQIRDAGRKSYLVVVGKVNVEKVANFSEIEVWVGVGCWEQGVVGGTEGRGWYRPVITPWELGIALGEREWEGQWIADFAEVLRMDEGRQNEDPVEVTNSSSGREDGDAKEEASEDEDAPPQFDLRTGQYVSTSRPLGARKTSSKPSASIQSPGDAPTSSALTTTSRQKELALTGGVSSPAARYLKEKRTWQGLGSDFPSSDAEVGETQGAVVEEGRSGVARGYIVDESGRH